MAGTNMNWDEYNDIPIHEINGITYAFMSYTYGLNGLTLPEGEEYAVNIWPGHEEEILEKVRQADQMADVVIMAMHWGTEYSMEVNDEQLTFARQLSDAGADIIVGNHPHVIQPVQWINGNKTICFYAMGNMISAQLDEENLVGVIGAVDIVKTVKGDETTISLENVKADLIWTDYVKYSDELMVDFKVYPFYELTDEILPGYQAIYEKYKAVLLSLDSSIPVGGFE